MLIGYFQLSEKMFYRSIITVVALAVVVYAEEFPIITDDKLLIS